MDSKELAHLLSLIDRAQLALTDLEIGLQRAADQPKQPLDALLAEPRTPEGDEYLRRYPDVAAHMTPPEMYGLRPRAHYLEHGQAEGRTWPLTGSTHPATHPAWTEANPTPMVTTPGGRTFPAPDPSENAMGYIQRVGFFIGKGADWGRRGAELMLGTDSLVPKSVPYPDGYGPWKENLANWPTMAETFWFPGPSSPADPGWQDVYNRLHEAERGSGGRTPIAQPEDPVFTGQFGADSLTDDEAAYVYAFTHTQAGTALANKVYWESGIFSGPRVSISRLVNRGEQRWNELHLDAWAAVAAWPDSPVKRAVLATAPAPGETPL